MARLLLAFQPPDGGVLRHVEELAEGFAARGHEVLACGPRRPSVVASERYVELPLERAIAPGADVRALVGLVRLLRMHAPDIVHLHSSKAGALGRLARWAAPAAPVVYSPHGYAFAGHFERMAERRAYRGLERALAPLATRVLCVCEAERRLACSVGPAVRTRVVHNGVEIPSPGRIDERVLAARARGPLAVVVTPLRPGKGVETMLDAMRLVLERHPTATLLIAGDGPEAAPLRERARELGLGDAVRFLGEVAVPTAVFAGGDVIVHPSWAESFPYAVLEAMSVAAPIVATDVGGTSEAIEHRRSGLLVPPRDASALAQSVADLIDDRERARSLGDAARRRVAQRFTLDRMVDGTLAVYAETSRRLDDGGHRS